MASIARRSHPLVALAAVILLSVSACSSGSSSDRPAVSTAPSAVTASPESSPIPSETPSVEASPSTSPSPTSSGTATAVFGSGCASVPQSGKGSFDGMAKDRVATAASNNPLLTTLVTAVKKAGLVDTLNNTEDITVFAPSNAAFESMNKKTLARALASKSRLTDILTLHVVKGRIAPTELAGTHKTLNGQTITVTGSGEDFTVNDSAKIVCGNVQTANATVYIIDHVLMP